MLTLAERQYDTRVKVVQTDNAGELTSGWFEEGLARLGVKHKLSIAYIHETNGTAERFNRTVTSSARALLFDSGLPLTMWGEAITQAIYTKNRMPHTSLEGRSPQEVPEGNTPDLGHLQTFGSPAHVFIPEAKWRTAGKLLARTVEGFLVGYAEQRNQYRFWIPSLGRVVVSHDFKARVVTSAPDVISIETAPVESPSMSPATCDPKATDSSCRPDAWQPTSFAEIRDHYPNLFESTVPEPSSYESAQPLSIIAPAPGTFPASVPGSPTRNAQEPPSSGQPVTLPTETSPASPLRESITCKPPTVPALEIRTRIGREVRPPSRFGEWGEMALFGLGDEDSPFISQALRSPDAASWRNAMEKEIASLEKYGTWEYVSPPPGGRFVDTKWVLKKKRDECGNLVKFKARLTAPGFTQIAGLDYDETFAAVVQTDTLRLLLAHAIQYQLHTVQYDIESAYLNAPLDEKIYIQPPAMVSVPDGKVLRLRKASTDSNKQHSAGVRP